MLHKLDIFKIASALRKLRYVSRVEILLIDEISERGFYKIRCTLVPSKYKLDIKYIKTEKEFLYSYQIYDYKAIARWDNEPHYPHIESHPHHFHYKDKVSLSKLTGNPMHDIKKIKLAIETIISSIQDDEISKQV